MNSLSDQLRPPPGKARRRERGKLRRVIADIHAWLGAIVGLFVILVGATGIALGFAYEMMRAETGGFEVSGVAPAGPPPVGDIVEKARATAGPDFIPLGYIGPNGEIVNPAPMIWGLSAPPDEGGDAEIVTFDPATGEATGNFMLYDTWTHWVIDLHYELLAGSPGVVLMAIIALLTAALALAGLVLWWPINRSALHKPFEFAWRGNYVRKSFSLHSLVGFWLAIPVLLWGVSGAYWNKSEWFPQAITPQLEAPSEAVMQQLSSADCGTSVSPQQALDAALAEAPGNAVVEMEFAAPWQPYHAVHLDTNGADRQDGDARVWVAAECPGTLAFARLTGAEATGPMLRALHSGRMFGGFRQVVIVLVGLSFVVLGLTGLILWWRRLRTAARP